MEKQVLNDDNPILDRIDDLYEKLKRQQKPKKNAPSPTLLILAADCKDFIWDVLPEEPVMVLDYSIKYAVSCGIRNVVIAVRESQKSKASEYLKKVRRKYSVKRAVATVVASNVGNVNQILEASEVINNDVIVVNADCFYEEAMFRTVIYNFSAQRPCVVGYIPSNLIAPESLYLHSENMLEKSLYTNDDYFDSVYWDWRVDHNMFGFDVESLRKIRAQYERKMKQNDQSLEKDTNYMLSKCIREMLADGFEIDCFKAKNKFFHLRSEKEMRENSIYDYKGALRLRNLHSISYGDHVDFFFYETSHHTLAISFDGYSVEYYLVHVALAKPYDTGIKISDLDDFLKSGVKTFVWATGGYDSSKSSLKLSSENGKLRLEYDGYSSLIMCGEKYPITTNFSFDKTTDVKILRELPSDKVSGCPKLLANPYVSQAADDGSVSCTK